MSVELPKDAEGREIPLGSEVLYDKHGLKFYVKNFRFYKAPSSKEGEWLVSGVFNDDTDDGYIKPKFLCITPPDSWEKLLDDLAMAETYEDSPNCDDPACAYARNIGKPCAECKLYEGDCVVNMCTDIADRISKLRSDGE